MLKQTAKRTFPSVQDLWKFVQRIQATNIEINARERPLVCDCDGLGLAIAQEEFNAQVVE